MLTYEDIPDMKAASERAAKFFAERFGDRKSLGRRQALDYIRRGWGVAEYATVEEVERSFDCAVGCEIKVSHTATFRVGYHMAPGHSAGGSSIGARPVSCTMFTADSVREWGEVALVRFACKLTEADHYDS